MLKTDFLAYISPWRYQLHTCSSLFIKAIALLILFIIFLLGNPGASEPSPSSQPAPLGSSGLPQLRQHPAALPSWETRPGPLLWKADGNLALAKMCPGISRIKIKTRGSLWFETKQVCDWTREAIWRRISAMWLRTAPKELGCSMGAQHGRAGLLSQRPEATQPLGHQKTCSSPFYDKLQQNREVRAELKDIPETTAWAYLHAMEGVTLALLQEAALSPAFLNTHHVHTWRRGLPTQSCTSRELFSRMYFCQGWARNDLVTASVQ